jgi:hypothetical protein
MTSIGRSESIFRAKTAIVKFFHTLTFLDLNRHTQFHFQPTLYVSTATHDKQQPTYIYVNVSNRVRISDNSATYCRPIIVMMNFYCSEKHEYLRAHLKEGKVSIRNMSRKRTTSAYLNQRKLSVQRILWERHFCSQVILGMRKCSMGSQRKIPTVSVPKIKQHKPCVLQ